MKKIHLLLALLALPWSGVVQSAVLITSFGTPGFTIEGGFTTIGTSQNASSTTLTGTVGEDFAGSFALADITGFTNILRLDGQVNGTNNGQQITIELLDSTLSSTRTYIGSLSGFGSGSPASINLALDSFDPGFLDNEVASIFISFGGTGAIDLRLDSLYAIPEPSSTALLLLAGLGALALRRHLTRRSAQ